MPSKPGQRQRRPFTWTPQRTKALSLIFEGRQSLDKIALDCAISARTLDDWIAHPDFQAQLTERREHLIESLDDQPYIRKERRLIGLAQMAEDARRCYEERRWLKEVRPTPDGPMTNESYNAAAHAAFRGALDDIAKELGQRTAKADASAQIALIAVAGDVLDAI